VGQLNQQNLSGHKTLRAANQQQPKLNFKTHKRKVTFSIWFGDNCCIKV
jgi:hypothetical protein